MVTFAIGVVVGCGLSLILLVLFACMCAAKDADEGAERARRTWL